VVVDEVDLVDLLVHHAPVEQALQFGHQRRVVGVDLVDADVRAPGTLAQRPAVEANMVNSRTAFIATSNKRSLRLIPLMRPSTSATK